MTRTQRSTLMEIIKLGGTYAKRKYYIRSFKYIIYDCDNKRLIRVDNRTFLSFIKKNMFVLDKDNGTYKITEKAINYQFKKLNNA